MLPNIRVAKEAEPLRVPAAGPGDTLVARLSMYKDALAEDQWRVARLQPKRAIMDWVRTLDSACGVAIQD